MTTVADRSAPSARRSRVALLAPAGAAAAVAGAVAYVVVRSPYEHELTPACALLTSLGIYCPGCGGTRAAYDLAHGDVVSALGMNALVVLGVPVVAVLWTRWVLRLLGVALRPWTFPRWGGWAIGAGIAVFWILRNLPPLAPLLSP